jgi:hypothetical protein
MLLFKISGLCLTVQYHNENTEHKQIVPAVGTASKTADEMDLARTRLVIFP